MTLFCISRTDLIYTSTVRCLQCNNHLSLLLSLDTDLDIVPLITERTSHYISSRTICETCFGQLIDTVNIEKFWQEISYLQLVNKNVGPPFMIEAVRTLYEQSRKL